MKSILELISIQTKDGSSAITDVTTRLNQLMELTEGGFHLDESTSRSGEDGSLTDLRISAPLTTSGPKATEIKRRLTLLQNNCNLIQFEEKINEETNQSTFIITGVVYPEFLNTTRGDFQFPLENTFSPEVNSVVIRKGLHDIRCTYVTVLVGDQMTYPIQDLQMLNDSSSQEYQEHNDVITYNENNTDDKFSVIDFLASNDLKEFHEIKRLLNQFCDLPVGNEFALYFQSSSPEFPIDLRVFFDKDEAKVKNAQLKLSGFVQAKKGIIYEVKSFEDSKQIAIIIKAVNKADLEEHFSNKKTKHLKGDLLERALLIIKEFFPHDEHIQDLVIVSGEGSFTRPFPHIRTQKFWPYSDTKIATIQMLSLLKELDCIDFDQRRENKYTVEKRNNANYVKVFKANFFNRYNDNFQYIIVPKDLDLLKSLLDYKESSYLIHN